MSVRDWKTSQKYIRVGHNKAIRNYFQTVIARTTREALRNSLLIYKNDSASQMLVKMQYFQQYLSGIKTETLPLIPDSWQPKINSNERPQLVVVFKPKSQSYFKPDSRWSLSIPHFDFTQANLNNQLRKIPEYDKGRYRGSYTLKDNSKIVVYAKNSNEAKRFITRIITNNLVKNNYVINRSNLNDEIVVNQVKGNYQELRVIPTYVKYYSTGQQNLKPDWVSFIN